MYCVKCGKQMANNSPVCVHCGATQEEQKVMPTTSISVAEREEPKTAEVKLGNVGKVFRVLTKVLLILGVILLFIALILVSNRDSSYAIARNVLAIIGGIFTSNAIMLYIVGLLFSGFSELLMNTRKTYEVLEKKNK